jgi:hypothetical protein
LEGRVLCFDVLEELGGCMAWFEVRREVGMGWTSFFYAVHAWENDIYVEIASDESLVFQIL